MGNFSLLHGNLSTGSDIGIEILFREGITAHEKRKIDISPFQSLPPLRVAENGI
jgi:hypothetical protein